MSRGSTSSVAYLHGRSDVPVLDLREPLLKAKQGPRLYFRRDTHWNGRGVFIGRSGDHGRSGELVSGRASDARDGFQ